MNVAGSTLKMKWQADFTNFKFVSLEHFPTVTFPTLQERQFGIMLTHYAAQQSE